MFRFHRAAIPVEDRTWAALAHLSGLAGYVIPLGGILAPVILMITRKENPVIHAIAKQALYLNLLCYALGIAMFLLFITVILIPVAILLSLLTGAAALGLPIAGAIMAAQGDYFAYPLVGQVPW